MTPSELKYAVETRGSDSHYFSRQSMKAFGDTMRNYGVRKTSVNTQYDKEGNYVGPNGVPCEVWELYRKRPVKAGNQSSA